MNKIFKKFHIANIFIVIVLFLYSAWYFFYFQFSLKLNPTNLTDLQTKLFSTYWYIMVIYVLSYFVIYIIIWIIKYKRDKKQINIESDSESKTSDDFYSWISSTFLVFILYSLNSLLVFAFYDSVSIENKTGIVAVNSLMTLIKVSPIILIEFPFYFVITTKNEKGNNVQ